MGSGLVTGVPKNPEEAGEPFDFSDVDPDEETTVSEPVSVENVDMVSEFIVVERFGLGNPLKDGMSQDMDFLGVGRVEPASDDAHAEGGTEETSLWTLLVTLVVAKLVVLAFKSLLDSEGSRPLPPTIHQRPEGLLRTLISSVLYSSISPVRIQTHEALNMKKQHV